MRKLLLVVVVLAGTTVLGIQAQAAVDSTDILIKMLVDKGVISEADAASVRAEMANTKQEEEASRKSFTATARRPIKIGGYLQGRYIHSSQEGFNDSLEARRIRLAVSGDATEHVDFKTQVDFAGSRKGITDANFDTSTTTTAQFARPLLLDAVIGYKLANNNRLDVGQFKIPFSLENLTSSPYLELINRSQVVEALVPGRDTRNQGRDIGVQYSGFKDLGDDGSRRLQYFAGLFNGAGINVGDDNDRKDIALRATLPTGLEGLTLGASLFDGATGTDRLAHNRTGGELVYNCGPWALKSEYITGRDAAVRKKGWYITLIRQLSPIIQGALRIDNLDPNTGAADDTVRTITAGISYFLSKDGYSRWQLNYERKRDDAANNPTDSILAQFQAGF